MAAERREEILDAVERCIIRYGVGETTLQRVADEAGLPRSNLAHFVGSRDEIFDAALTRCVTRFAEEMTQLVADLPPSQRLPVFFDAVMADTPDVARRTALLNELHAAGGRDEHARVELARGLAQVDAWIEQMFVDRFPDADPAQRTAIAASVALMLKEHDRARVIDASHRGPALTDDVRLVIELLVEQLGSPAEIEEV